MKVREKNLVEKRIEDACRLESAIVFSFSVANYKEAVISHLVRAQSAAQRFVDEMKEVYKNMPMELGSVRRGELELKEGLDMTLANIRRQSELISGALKGMSESERTEELLSFGTKIKEEAVKGAGRRARLEITTKILSALDFDSRGLYPESNAFIDALMLRILRSEPDSSLRRDIWDAAGIKEGAALSRAAAAIPTDAIVDRPAPQQPI